MLTIKVSESMAGKRLDNVVLDELGTLSRSSIQKLCKYGRIYINKIPAKPGQKLHLGDKILVDYDEDSSKVIPEISIPILYEDEDCVVINKPIGVLSHSKGAFNPEATVATWLAPKFRGPANDRAGIAHRLDRATSGVMICAKNETSLKWLQKQFSGRKVKKTYVAVIDGHLAQPEAIIDMPIERNPKAPATFRVGANGRSAQTQYKVLKTSKDYTLLELTPKTGRTHQLRVHLAKLGHPIVGDLLYGGGVGKRMLLHATTLELTLPSKKRLVFKAPVPKIFKEQLDQND